MFINMLVGFTSGLLFAIATDKFKSDGKLEKALGVLTLMWTIYIFSEFIMNSL